MKGKLKVEFEIAKDYVVGAAVVADLFPVEEATRLLEKVDVISLDTEDSQSSMVTQMKIALALVAVGAAAEQEKAKEI